MVTRYVMLLPAMLIHALLIFTPVPEPVIVEGTVYALQSGKPLSSAHVYIVHGEEEALTNDKGQFRIKSWQKLPVRLTIDAKGYKSTTLTIANPSQKQHIRLLESR